MVFGGKWIIGGRRRKESEIPDVPVTPRFLWRSLFPVEIKTTPAGHLLRLWGFFFFTEKVMEWPEYTSK